LPEWPYFAKKSFYVFTASDQQFSVPRSPRFEFNIWNVREAEQAVPFFFKFLTFFKQELVESYFTLSTIRASARSDNSGAY
jgi:hypothetical protein